MRKLDAVVVGAGAVGSCAAVALANAGWKTALVAPRSTTSMSPQAPTAPETPVPPAPDTWDPRVFALSASSRRLLQQLGAWQHLPEARIAPVYRMRLLNGCASGSPAIDLDAYRAGVEALAWIVENGSIERALDQRLDALGVERIDGRVAALQAIDAAPAGRRTLSLESGERLDARLVVAADGRDSVLREMAGIPGRIDDRNQVALVTWFESTRSPADTAWQWFDPRGVVALLPLPADGLEPGRGRVSLVWSLHAEHARRLLRTGDIRADLRSVCGDTLGQLEQKADLASFPIRSVRCEDTVAPGVVVIGDAAHAVHPMAGQGMNLGFGDVEALIRTTAGIRPAHVDFPVLRRYERARKESVRAMQFCLDALERVFPRAEAPVALARDLAWQAVARSPLLQRRLIRHAVA